MSTACTTLKWVEEEQRVFDKAQQNLCHQMIDDYNKLTKPISFVISITVITGLGHGSGGGPFGCGGFKCSALTLMFYINMHTCTFGNRRRVGFLLIMSFRSSLHCIGLIQSSIQSRTAKRSTTQRNEGWTVVIAPLLQKKRLELPQSMMIQLHRVVPCIAAYHPSTSTTQFARPQRIQHVAYIDGLPRITLSNSGLK